MVAHTNLSKSSRTFAFCFGFMEGKGHSRQLRKLLLKAGFQLAPLTQADIIIAHSAGCALIPKQATPKLVIYTGMPLILARPKSTWVKVSLPRRKDGSLRHGLIIRVRNSYYTVRHIKRNVGIMRDPRIAQPVIFPKVQSVFIANRHDPWPKGAELNRLIDEQPWAFLSLPGAHENLWHEPERYIPIINHYAKQVLA
jgi:hypothetical protein